MDRAGEKIMLMMLNACDMLPIGEDLGAVPPGVRACLSQLGICGHVLCAGKDIG